MDYLVNDKRKTDGKDWICNGCNNPIKLNQIYYTGLINKEKIVSKRKTTKKLSELKISEVEIEVIKSESVNQYCNDCWKKLKK